MHDSHQFKSLSKTTLGLACLVAFVLLRSSASSQDKQLHVKMWERKLDFYTGLLVSELPLSFEPRLYAHSPSGKLIVVLDAFAGEIVLVDSKSMKIVDQLSLQGHNLRGIKFLDETTFLITHQILHADVSTTADNIAAGLVMENVIHEMHIKHNANGSAKLVSGSLKELGVPSHGAADPAGIEVDQNGNIWIALSGVDEVLVLNSNWEQRQRIGVGNRPLTLNLINDQMQVFNQLDESYSYIDVNTFLITATNPIQTQTQLTNRQRGRDLFFDGNTSRFGWMSCHSCHPDGHTNFLLADTFADGTAGAPKRVLSLLGGRDNNPWAWNGSNRSLHDQVLQSGKTTMQGPGFSAKQVNDLVAYLHTLDPPRPFQPPQNSDDVALIDQGRIVFHQRACAKCHIPPLTYTSDTVFDVGLEDEHGVKKFNPPSLIGVGSRRSLFHDGRAETLEDVLIEYGHQLESPLNEQEQRALTRFLRSL